MLHHHGSAGEAGQEPGLRFALVITPAGSVREIGWTDIAHWRPEDGFLWLHLERDDPVTQAWLHDRSGLDPLVAQALAADESRPRVEPVDDNLLLVLRGINKCAAEQGDEECDLVPLHIWAEPDRCITLRDKDHSLEALRDLRLLILAGKGPRRAGPLLARIAEKVVDHLGAFTEQIEEQLGEQEEVIGDNQGDKDTRRIIGDMRRQIVRLRRYIAPQRDALFRMRLDDAPWLCEESKARLREVEDKLSRNFDHLDEMRQRAALLHEEMDAKTAEATNRNTFLISIVSVIMLPMTFVTGFFGMNTGGLPFNAEDPAGTVMATLLIVLVGAITVAGTLYLLRRRS